MQQKIVFFSDSETLAIKGTLCEHSYLYAIKCHPPANLSSLSVHFVIYAVLEAVQQCCHIARHVAATIIAASFSISRASLCDTR